MLDKKTISVIEGAVVKHRIDVAAELKKFDNLNSTQVHKVMHRGGYFTNGHMADMLSAKLEGINEILGPLRELKETAVDPASVTVKHTDMPDIRKMVEDKWPLFHSKHNYLPIEAYVYKALTTKKGAARKHIDIAPHKFE